MFRVCLISVAMTAATVGVANADEVWTDEFGENVAYDRDVGTTAILRGPHDQWFYVDRLAGNYANRTGTFHGYWAVMPDDADGEMIGCASTLTLADGRSTPFWGPIEVDFDGTAFPTGFTMRSGFCPDQQGEYASQQVGTFNSFRYTPVTADSPK